MSQHPGLRAALRGRVQQELARRRLRGRRAGRRARRRGPRDRRRRGRSPTTSPPRSATTAPPRCCAPRAPRASRSRSSTRWPRSSSDGGYDYALFGGGLLGFEIGAGLAARLRRRRGDGGHRRSSVEDGELVAERPILRRLGDLRDRATGRLGHHHRPPERVRDPRAPAAARGGRGRRRRALGLLDRRPRWSQRGEQRGADVDIEGADVLIAGGRGLGKAEGFELAEDLAAAFGGNPPSPRPARWSTPAGSPTPAQIGQTGKTVAPKLYLAAGHLRRDPAQGRHAELGEHRRDQQGRERADLRVLRPRRSWAT